MLRHSRFDWTSPWSFYLSINLRRWTPSRISWMWWWELHKWRWLQLRLFHRDWLLLFNVSRWIDSLQRYISSCYKCAYHFLRFSSAHELHRACFIRRHRLRRFRVQNIWQKWRLNDQYRNISRVRILKQRLLELTLNPTRCHLRSPGHWNPHCHTSLSLKDRRWVLESTPHWLNLDHSSSILILQRSGAEDHHW